MANIKFPEGTTWRHEFDIKDSSGAAIDLTGAALTWAAYPLSASKVGVPVPFLSKTILNGIVVLDAVAGQIRVDFTPAETVDTAGTYNWELQLVEANGDTWLAGSGTLVIQPARYLDG